jgi:hypothetical protein
LRVEFWLQVVVAVRVRTPKREAAENSLEKRQLGGALRVLLAARNQLAMHLPLVAMEQPMLAVAVAVITAVEVEPIMAAAAVGPHSLMQVYSAWCTLRHIR